jgi:hypothetical protein
LRHSIRIGPAPRGDAARLLEPKLALDRETSFTMLEPGERRRTPAERALELDEIDGRTSSLVLVADGERRCLATPRPTAAASAATGTPRTSRSASGRTAGGRGSGTAPPREPSGRAENRASAGSSRP